MLPKQASNISSTEWNSLVSKQVPAGSCCQACCYRSHGRQYNIWHNLMKPYSRLIWVQISFWITAKGSRLLKADTKAIPGLLTKAQLHFQHTPLHSPQAGSMLSRCTYHLLSVVIARTWCAPPFVSVLPFPAPSVTIENYRSANMMQLLYFEQNVTWLKPFWPCVLCQADQEWLCMSTSGRKLSGWMTNILHNCWHMPEVGLLTHGEQEGSTAVPWRSSLVAEGLVTRCEGNKIELI